MVTRVELKGMDAFSKFTESIDNSGPPVFFFFSGSKLPNGTSWCPDCVEATKKKIKIDLHYLNNYKEYTIFLDKLPEKGRPVYFFFLSSKKENGRGWCIYCQLAEPIVQAYLNELQKSIIFAYVDVGDRDYWKDKMCPFRTDNRTKLMVIPTLTRWKGVQRLEGSQCNKRELLQMMFEDEE